MSKDDIESTCKRIDELLKEEWSNEEIFSYLRWAEEVTKTEVSEETCLKRMLKVRQSVYERLGKNLDKKNKLIS